jgi:hypothetical protein
MNHAVVLHVAPIADADEEHVTTHGRVAPD